MADPQLRLEVIIISTVIHVHQANIQVEMMFIIGGPVRLSKWIVDDFVFSIFRQALER